MAESFGHHIEGRNFGIGDGVGNREVDFRPPAERRMDLAGDALGVVLPHVANCDEVDIGHAGLGQGGKTLHVPASHAAAADEADWHFVHCTHFLFLDRAAEAIDEIALAEDEDDDDR